MTKPKKTSTKTKTKTAEASPEAPTMEALEAMAARIAELEGQNEAMKEAATAINAPQAVDTVRKNATEKMVRITRSGNVRTDVDPSLELVAEAAAQGEAS